MHEPFRFFLPLDALSNFPSDKHCWEDQYQQKKIWGQKVSAQSMNGPIQQSNVEESEDSTNKGHDSASSAHSIQAKEGGQETKAG